MTKARLDADEGPLREIEAGLLVPSVEQLFDPLVLPQAERESNLAYRPGLDYRIDFVRWSGPAHELSPERENEVMAICLSEWADQNPNRQVKSLVLRYDDVPLLMDFRSPRLIAMIHSEPLNQAERPFGPSERGFEVLRFHAADGKLAPKQEDAGISAWVNSWIESNPDKLVSKITMSYDYPPNQRGFSAPRAIVGIHWIDRQRSSDPSVQQEFIATRHLLGCATLNENGTFGLTSAAEEDRQTQTVIDQVLRDHPDARLKASTCQYQWGPYHPGGRTGPRYMLGFLLERSAHPNIRPPEKGFDLVRSVGYGGMPSREEDLAAAEKFRQWLRDNPDKKVTGFTQQYDYGTITADRQSGRYIFGLQWEEATGAEREDAKRRDVHIVRWLGPTGRSLLSPKKEGEALAEAVRKFTDSRPGIEVEHAKLTYTWGAFTQTEQSGPRMIVTLVYKHPPGKFRPVSAREK